MSYGQMSFYEVAGYDEFKYASKILSGEMAFWCLPGNIISCRVFSWVMQCIYVIFLLDNYTYTLFSFER